MLASGLVPDRVSLTCPVGKLLVCRRYYLVPSGLATQRRSASSASVARLPANGGSGGDASLARWCASRVTARLGMRLAEHSVCPDREGWTHASFRESYNVLHQWSIVTMVMIVMKHQNWSTVSFSWPIRVPFYGCYFSVAKAEVVSEPRKTVDRSFTGRLVAMINVESGARGRRPAKPSRSLLVHIARFGCS